MRYLISIYCLFAVVNSSAQIAVDLSTETDLQAFRAFDEHNYSIAEKLFYRLFLSRPSEENARYYYYALVYQGRDLEAAFFRKHNARFTFAIPEAVKGVENIYVEAGPRIAMVNTISNMFYGTIGSVFRTGQQSRLWIAGNYLERRAQDPFKQYEILASWYYYTNNGWMVTPSVHYAYTPYEVAYSDDSTLNFTIEREDGHGPYQLKTNALQTTDYHSSGFANYLNASLKINKHVGRIDIDIEPSWHLGSDNQNTVYTYTAAGTTDSFRNGSYLASTAYKQSGNGWSNQFTQHQYYQLGGAIGYRLPLSEEPMSIKVAAYWLADEYGNNEMAWYLFARYRIAENVCTYISYLNKGSLPFILNQEGQYFNTFNRINGRFNVSLQLLPLRKLSPVITYQYEQDRRTYDNVLLDYHSLYFSLKYRL